MDILRDSGIFGMLSITFRDMGIQGFLNFLDFCHIYFRDMGYFPKYLKGIWDTGTPLPHVPGPQTFLQEVLITHFVYFHACDCSELD